MRPYMPARLADFTDTDETKLVATVIDLSFALTLLDREGEDDRKVPLVHAERVGMGLRLRCDVEASQAGHVLPATGRIRRRTSQKISSIYGRVRISGAITGNRKLLELRTLLRDLLYDRCHQPARKRSSISAVPLRAGKLTEPEARKKRWFCCVKF